VTSSPRAHAPLLAAVHELTCGRLRRGLRFDGASLRASRDPGVRLSWGARPEHASSIPFPPAHDSLFNCYVKTRSTGEPSRATLATSREGRMRTQGHGISDPSISGRSGVLHLDSARSTRPVLGLTTTSTRRGVWNSVREFELDWVPNSGTIRRYRMGLPPFPPMDSFPDLLSDMILTLDNWASRSRVAAPEWAPPSRPISTCASTRCLQMATSTCSTYVVRTLRTPRYPVTFNSVTSDLPDNGSVMPRHPSCGRAASR